MLLWRSLCCFHFFLWVSIQNDIVSSGMARYEFVLPFGKRENLPYYFHFWMQNVTYYMRSFTCFEIARLRRGQFCGSTGLLDAAKPVKWLCDKGGEFLVALLLQAEEANSFYSPYRLESSNPANFLQKVAAYDASIVPK